MTRSRALSSFVFLWLLSAAVEWRALASTLSLSLQNDEFTHILLIFPVALVLIFLDWAAITSVAETNRRVGCTLLALANAIATVAGFSAGFTPDVKLSLAMLATVLWWIGSFVLCFGVRAFRLVLFPLIFLFWMVPFPQGMLEWTIHQLQAGSAYCAGLLFAAVGIPVSQTGLLISIPGVTLEVAKECSSIRSSMLLVVTSMVLAHLLLRSGWGKALVIAAAFPLAVAKNGLRIFCIGYLGTRVDPGFLTGNFHRHGGIIFFLIAMAAILLLIWVLRRTENRKQPAVRSATATS